MKRNTIIIGLLTVTILLAGCSANIQLGQHTSNTATTTPTTTPTKTPTTTNTPTLEQRVETHLEQNKFINQATVSISSDQTTIEIVPDARNLETNTQVQEMIAYTSGTYAAIVSEREQTGIATIKILNPKKDQTIGSLKIRPVWAHAYNSKSISGTEYVRKVLATWDEQHSNFY